MQNTLSNQLGHTERIRVPCVLRKQSGVISSYSFIPISHKKSFTKIVTILHTKCVRDFFRCRKNKIEALIFNNFIVLFLIFAKLFYNFFFLLQEQQ